jgi:hypothetical protein
MYGFRFITELTNNIPFFQPLLVMLSFVAITLYQINQSQNFFCGILAFQRYLNLLFLRRP